MDYGSPSKRSVSDGTLGKRYTSYCSLALGFAGNLLTINFALRSLLSAWFELTHPYSAPTDEYCCRGGEVDEIENFCQHEDSERPTQRLHLYKS